MSLSESVYTLSAAESHEARAAQYGDFLENVIGLKIKEDYTSYSGTSGTVYWLDENKTVGFAAVCTTYNSNTKSGIIPYYPGRKISQSSTSNYTDGLLSVTDETKIYYQKSQNDDVVYFRIGTEAKAKMAAAKDTLGVWYIFHYDSMYHKNGSVTATNGVAVSDSSLFTAAKMPTIVSSNLFTELYRMISATSFIEANTYVNFNNQPYKVISTGGSSVLPCFAFPISD